MLLTLRFSAIMGILVRLVGQILDLLACEAAVRVEDRVFVSCIGQHALLLAMPTLYFLKSLFDTLWGTRLIHISSDTKIGAPS